MTNAVSRSSKKQSDGNGKAPVAVDKEQFWALYLQERRRALLTELRMIEQLQQSLAQGPQPETK